MKRGEVWWVSFDPSLGSEIRKTRPAVIVSNDEANAVLTRVQVVPITSNVDRIYPGEALVLLNGEPRRALANQLTTVSKERFGKRLGVIDEDHMAAIEAAIKMQLDLF